MKKIRKYWVARTQADVANIFGVSSKTVQNWRAAGMPGQRGAWPLGKIAKWLRAEGPWKSAGDDPLMQGENSPALERYREARADKAENDVKIQEGKYIDRDLTHEAFAIAAGINRVTGRKLEKMFGREALNIFNAGFVQSENAVVRVFGKP